MKGSVNGGNEDKKEESSGKRWKSRYSKQTCGKSNLKNWKTKLHQPERKKVVCVPPEINVAKRLNTAAKSLPCENKFRFQHHIIPLNFPYVKVLGDILAIKEAKHFKWGPITEGLAGSRINMGKHNIQPVLREAVKRVVVRDDVANIVMVVFNMGLLA